MMSLLIGSMLGFLIVGTVIGGVGYAIYAIIKPLLPKKPTDSTPENLEERGITP
jgi:hypothetical protein